MKIIYLNCLIIALSLTAFSVAAQLNEKQYTASAKAHKLAQQSIIVDGHIDVPYRLYRNWVDVTESTEDGDFDFPRVKAGALNAPFMSIYTPASIGGSTESTELAHKLIDSVEALVGRAPDKYAIATSPDQIEQHFKQGLVSLPLGMENGSPLQGDLNNLKVFYDRGVRYITLAHSKSNDISDSSYDKNHQWNGLSDFGEKVVKEMNRLGIMVDVSHLSDEAFYDVMRVTQKPAIASHSSLRAFVPGFERNMDDDMIKALAKNGGVIMINFGSTFVDEDSRKWATKRSSYFAAAKAKFGEDSEEYKNYTKTYSDHTPLPFADLDKVVDHIDHAVKLMGINHVGLGSDYDGVGDTLPIGLKDVSTYPNLIQGLLDRNYNTTEIKKILGGNVLRVWREVER